MTHAYGDCGGVRYLTNGLKVGGCFEQCPHACSAVACMMLMQKTGVRMWPFGLTVDLVFISNRMFLPNSK